MPFIVGLGLISLGGLVIWGGISGRFAKMAAAVFPSDSSVQTTSFTAPPTGFQQLNLNGGVTLAPDASGNTASSVTVNPGSSVPSASGTGASSIPAWESQSLSSLAAQGSLSGVPAIVLAGIDQAESSGQGGYINSSGYGGFFGLGANTQYPTGHTSPGLLTSTDPQSFITQAEIAAGEFASLLRAVGGNVYAAESKYQGGSSEGAGVFASLGIPQTLTAPPTSVGAVV